MDAETDAIRIALTRIFNDLPGDVVCRTQSWERQSDSLSSAPPVLCFRVLLSADRASKPFVSRVFECVGRTDMESKYGAAFQAAGKFAREAALAWCEFPERFESRAGD